MSNLKNQKGQGLIEVIIAIAVITVGLFAVWTLFMSNFNGEQEAKARVVGANFAREGIEAVKNIRDSNWLHGDENEYDAGNFWGWDHNLAPGTYIIDDLFSTSSLDVYDGMVKLSPISLPTESEKIKLYIDGDGFFSENSSGRFSGYSRLITIKNICCNSDTGDGNTEEYIIKEQCATQDFSLSDGPCGPTSAKVGVDVQVQVDWLLNKSPKKIVIEDQLFDWR